jgi:hypothetical protein
MRTNITLPDRFARLVAGVLLLYTLAGWNRRQRTMREVQHGRQS